LAERDAQFHASQVPRRHAGLFPSPTTRDLVGIISPCYGCEKVTYSLPTERYAFRKVFRAPIHRFERRGNFLRETPIVLDHSVALLHTFNEIPIATRPFLITVENEIPRYFDVSPRGHRFGHDRLASQRCRGMFALSETAAEVIRERFRQRGYEELCPKVGVFRGGLQPSSGPRLRRSSDGPLRALFVGGDAFRKGLLPALEAVEAVRKGGLDVELTVVSALHVNPGYPFYEHTPDSRACALRLAELDFVTHHRGLPNARVRELMREHDVLLFPTFDESLGWVVAEAGLEGLPSVASNIFAVPEMIDHESTGLTIAIELGAQSRWTGCWQKGDALRESLERDTRTLRDGVVSALERMCSDRDLAPRWGDAAREKMIAWYELPKAARELEGLYDRLRD